MAMKRLLSLEKRLGREPSLLNKVHEQVEQYEKKHYAHRATVKELECTEPQHTWYLPLGVVVNPKKPNKLRLVWDAAASAGGTSFNDLLLKGPDLLTCLPAVLMRFRQRKIAVCGDIREMFHQIMIRAEDKQYQRFLWRNKNTGAVEVYIMDVATFGATCSPCSAQFVKNKNAQQFIDSYPRAVQAITENHYVDDFLDSVDTVEEAVALISEVKHIHSAAGFEITSFASNSCEVLHRIGEVEQIQNKQMSLKQQDELKRVLGMIWQPLPDTFTFDVSSIPEIVEQMNSQKVPTKRQVLRTVMSLFDPLGLIAHFVIHGKVLMQEIWRSGTAWDDAVPEHLIDKWFRWAELLKHLNDVQVPRCYFSVFESHSKSQLHVFVDASEAAYACVAYLRLVNKSGAQCSLIAAKTKVAPLKTLSVPRLELQAAIIGARLAQNICASLTVPIDSRYMWTDSSTVLAWLRSDHRRYHQFVAVRIGEILTISNVEEWRYVPSKLNVADEATKWGSGPTFDPNSRWFSGPSFLQEYESKWPPDTKKLHEPMEELRGAYSHCLSNPTVDVKRFSTWTKLVRTMAYVYRAIAVMKRQSSKNIKAHLLMKEEIVMAEIALWRQVQAETYPAETAAMRNNKSSSVDKSSPLYQFSPFMDDEGVIRHGGRIEAAPNVSYSTKYPVILPKSHRITSLLIENYHQRFRHANAETVYNEIRQQFIIPNLRSLIRKAARSCQWCKIKNAAPSPPPMAPLPKERLTPFIRPFTYIGVDYFGPLEVKVGRSLVKRWVALFTCLTIRAVHLEVVHSMSTRSCVMAFRRFVARRGSPLKVYSDNGTNFVGASRQLSEEVQRVQKIGEDCAATFTNAQTSWHFNPPASPHMGGLWERMVRSVKVAMKAIAEHKRHPSDEVLETILLEAESMINSRPLTYVPLETADQEALTPNHFLLYGSSGVKQPVAENVDFGSTLRDSWKLAQYIVNQFWKRWVQEYLPTISRRTKWFENVKPIKPGDVVILVDEAVRNRWERGRVLETFCGRDGVVRSAVVRTARGTFSRPVVKLALLDVEHPGKPEKTVQGTDLGMFHGQEDVSAQNYAPTGNSGQE